MTVGEQKAGFVFTGWHMLAIMVAFFGTVFTVNFTMAYFASSTWSGLVVPNTYVASQEFNDKAAAIRGMLATGIKGKLEVKGQQIHYTLMLPGNRPVVADKVTAHFKRPVGEKQDFFAEFQATDAGHYEATGPVLPGYWIVEVIATRDGKTIMHEANRIAVIGETK
ncbi:MULTISPECIES: FixH family protein [Alphaproteobacteria]|uniref:Cation transporter n=2 Tax=Alphaproteobacteria TaxID=28211 RepID=A0A512HHW7_9HYPH|nr:MULTISPECIES: FixH family protein [Alphaproteobacteria]GEO85038.1 cation transporter [Ciceribacter naphthalenivorans]GLR22972.1 cation transporter [Ciceribacter naphthalenivorans]GLT05828.1 cation transporter [Sphingomonas psychrolutea]